MDNNSATLLNLGIGVLKCCWLNYCGCFSSFATYSEIHMFLVIDFCLGWKIIFVLLVLRLILFAFNHCTKIVKSWLMRAFILMSDLFISSKFVSHAKWWILLLFIHLCRFFIIIRNNNGLRLILVELCGWSLWEMSWFHWYLFVIVCLFFKILIFLVVRGKRAKNSPKWQKIVCHAPYLRNHTPYDCHLWYTVVEW